MASSVLGAHAFLKRPLDHAESEAKRQARRLAASDKDVAFVAVLLCYWPETLAGVRKIINNHTYQNPAPALCHALTRKDIQAGTWQGFGRLFTAGPTLLTFWHRGATHPFTLPRTSLAAPFFPWGRYVLGMAKQEAVVGNEAGIIKFYIANVPGVAAPPVILVTVW